MPRPTRPSFPAPSEPSLRRLGVGGSVHDRPLRAQLVVVLVGLLVLIAVPLYLWRRPSGKENTEVVVPSTSISVVPAVPSSPPEAAVHEERVKLGAVQRVKCSASSVAKGQEGPLCDALPVFEDALAKAIRENVDCAPNVGEGGTINYVLKIDFVSRHLHVFPGASGTWKGAQAKRAAKCVLRSLPPPNWPEIQHQYGYYLIALMANYPAKTSATATGAELFEDPH